MSAPLSTADPTGDPAHEFILAFADDEHLMGQQHTEWIGVAPFLEEDLAFSSIAQDELGHAAMLYASLVGDEDSAIDALAFRRKSSDWRSCHLVELRLTDWDDTLVRHWLYDAFEALRWQQLAESNNAKWSAIAGRALGEERFHRRHADALLDPLLATSDVDNRLRSSLALLLPHAIGCFEPVDGETELIATGLLKRSTPELLPAWQQAVDARFGSVQWDSIGAAATTSGRTQRHADFDPLLARINEVFDLEPGTEW